MRTMMILMLAVFGIAGCAQPATDCTNVAAWMDLSLQTRDTPPPDGSKDAEYTEAVTARSEIKKRLTEHELQFATSLVKQFANADTTNYAVLYALCRKWETGNY